MLRCLLAACFTGHQISEKAEVDRSHVFGFLATSKYIRSTKNTAVNKKYGYQWRDQEVDVEVSCFLATRKLARADE